MDFFSSIREFCKLPEFADEKDRIVARILCGFLVVVFPAFAVLFWTHSKIGQSRDLAILIINFVLILSTFWLVKKRNIKLALIVLIMTTLTVCTLFSTWGQGIHDIGIVFYPGILILAGLLLDQKYFYVILTLVVACIAWLAFGDMTGLYSAKPYTRGTARDFYIVATLVIVIGNIAFLLSMNLRESLKRLQNENMERRKIELQLKQNLKEKDVLLREVHHRVKNNLNVINSLMNLQERNIHTKEDAIAAFKNTHNRIYAMSLVHELLYQSDKLSYIPMHSYLESLSRRLFSVFRDGKPVTLEIDISEHIILDISTAIPCGMILSEAVTNAMKYGFPDEHNEGVIAVSLRKQEDEHLMLAIADNGVGIPAHVNVTAPDTMGIYLIRLLSEQINGRINIFSDSGTVVEVLFPWT